MEGDTRPPPGAAPRKIKTTRLRRFIVICAIITIATVLSGISSSIVLDEHQATAATTTSGKAPTTGNTTEQQRNDVGSTTTTTITGTQSFDLRSDSKTTHVQTKNSNIATNNNSPPPRHCPRVIPNDDERGYTLYHLRKTGQGLGSLTRNAMMLGMYFELAQNRTLIIDERDLEAYRWNDTHHLYEGFYDPQFCLYHGTEFPNNTTATTFCDLSKFKKKTNISDCRVLKASMLDGDHLKAMRTARDYFSRDQLRIYEALTEYTCRQLPRLSVEAQVEVDRMLREYPSDFTVAFHIRRGDKITETRYYEADEYVDRFIRAVNNTSTSKGHVYRQAKHCFVATDDYKAVEELQQALKRADIPCQLWTLTKSDYETTRDRGDFLLFLAQTEILIRANFFVGSFSSNVGELVALLRGCPRSRDSANGMTVQNHFHSYGVDRNPLY